MLKMLLFGINGNFYDIGSENDSMMNPFYFNPLFSPENGIGDLKGELPFPSDENYNSVYSKIFLSPCNLK